MKILKINLGEKEITLNLGNNYFFEYFVEQTGVDLYKDGLVDIVSINLPKYVKGFVVAGAMAECAARKTDPPDIDFLKHEVMCLNDTEVWDLYLECIAVRSGKTVEELKNALAQAAKENGTTELIEG